MIPGVRGSKGLRVRLFYVIVFSANLSAMCALVFTNLMNRAPAAAPLDSQGLFGGFGEEVFMVLVP